MSDKLRELVEDIDGRFRSGNAIPVDRVWLTQEKWNELRDLLPAEPVAAQPVAWACIRNGQVAHAGLFQESAYMEQHIAGGDVVPLYTTTTEPAPDREDAERFAWLRANCEIDSTYCDVVKLSFPCEIDGFDTLDEAIDAARQEQA